MGIASFRIRGQLSMGRPRIPRGEQRIDACATEPATPAPCPWPWHCQWDHVHDEARRQRDIDGQSASVSGISSGQPSASSAGSPNWAYRHHAHGCGAFKPRWTRVIVGYDTGRHACPRNLTTLQERTRGAASKKCRETQSRSNRRPAVRTPATASLDSVG
jgi:hypothetical protein